MYYIDKEHTTRLLMDLVSIESPYFEEDDIMEYVYKWFKENNIDVFVHEYHESKVTGLRGGRILL